MALTTETTGIDVAQFYYDQRRVLAEDAPILRELIRAIDAEYDLTRAQWAQWYTIALGFRPDLIVELGRSKGNSTALFTQAASRLGGSTRVVSLCNSKDWVEESLPRVRAVVPPGWFDRLDARIADILDVDYEQLFSGAGRVLLLWDAHGFEIAETVLGTILPLIADRPHLVLMHDISDNRYAAVARSYEGQPIWKGSTWDKGVGKSRARVNIGWMNSLQDQVVAIADFAARNGIEVGSADHEYARFFTANPACAREMTTALGDEFFAVVAHFAFLSLAGHTGPVHYPAVSPKLRNRCDAVIRDVHPRRRIPRRQRWPRTIETAPVRWQYAAVMDCQPSTELPRDAQPLLRLSVEVSNAAVGIGLLSADRSTFVESRRVLPGRAAEQVFLPIRDRSLAPRLVVHTWDEPFPGTVRIDDISFVW
jgi:hypothetical protein